MFKSPDLHPLLLWLPRAAHRLLTSVFVNPEEASPSPIPELETDTRGERDFRSKTPCQWTKHRAISPEACSCQTQHTADSRVNGACAN